VAKLTLKLLLIGLPVLGVAAMNYVFDPSHLFHGFMDGSEQTIANLLMQNQNVAGLPLTFNDREVERLYVERSNRRLNIMVLGSSRTMEVRERDFPGLQFFNHSVSAGTIQDSFSIYDLYRRWHNTPDAVVLDIDPWAFNINNSLLHQSAILVLDDYADLAARLGLRRPWRIGPEREWARWAQLVSPALFQMSVKKAWRGSSPWTPHATSQAADDRMVLLADGSRRMPARVSNLTPVEVLQIAATFAANRPMLALEQYSSLDRVSEEILERFIDVLQEDGVRVVLFLAPYHPVVYSAIQSEPDYHRVIDAEQFVRQLGTDRHVMVAGSFAPEVAGCSDTEFFDAIHPKQRCVEHILETDHVRDRLFDERFERVEGVDVDR
jgi:hypothetical protein